jgi:hypothetical protein
MLCCEQRYYKHNRRIAREANTLVQRQVCDCLVAALRSPDVVTIAFAIEAG